MGLKPMMRTVSTQGVDVSYLSIGSFSQYWHCPGFIIYNIAGLLGALDMPQSLGGVTGIRSADSITPGIRIGIYE
jgi:hypothetical protein